MERGAGCPGVVRALGGGPSRDLRWEVVVGGGPSNEGLVFGRALQLGLA